MILQTGFRTDIPGFYSTWFANRLRAGFVLVRNPYNPQSVTRYAINPDVVDLIGFCTKNPAPMLPRMELLRPYGQYWFVTITPYGPEIEPHVPPKAQVLQDFITLSKIVGPDCIAWRYDPIFLSDTYTAARHIAEFEQMASVLSGYTRTCVISFIDLYEKVRRNFPQVKSVPLTERETLGKAFIEIGKKYGMMIRPCAEGTALARYGADCSGCMTQRTFEAALHRPLRLPPQKPARKECACCLTADIGAYNTCGHGCLYCYANASRVTVAQNMRMHDPASPFLVGHSQPGDVIHEAKQESWLVDQISMAVCKKAALPAQPFCRRPYSAYSLTAPVFCRAAITAGIRTSCTIMPGTALSSAPAKNAWAVNALPPKPSSTTSATPQTSRPATMAVSSAAYTPAAPF